MRKHRVLRVLPDFCGAALIAACLAAGLFAASPAAAQEESHAPPRWIADAKTGCKVWDPAPEAGESVSWSGPCKAGFAEGEGTLQWFLHGKKGDRYDGGYAHGKRNGYGVVTFANGETVKGAWLDDKLIQLPTNEIDYIERR
jgi:MORN repeat